MSFPVYYIVSYIQENKKNAATPFVLQLEFGEVQIEVNIVDLNNPETVNTLVAKIGFSTLENGSLKVGQKLVPNSYRVRTGITET